MRSLPTQPRPRTLTRRTFIAGSLTAASALALYSNEFARHNLEIAERTFFIRNLPPAFDSFRIVQFSDIHLEQYTEDFFLKEVIARVNALKADLVLVTGDFVSRGPLSVDYSLASAARCGELLSTLTCPQRFGILGNHDVVVGARVVRDHMEDNGLPLLVNQYTRIEHNGQHIFLGGLDDFSGGSPDLTQGMPASPDAPVIVMVHEPDYAINIVNHRRGELVDLVLSGHTHGGQVRIPGLRPLALPPWGKIFPEGHYLLDGLQLYVNRGIGTVGIPLRLNCPPEITVATLKPAVRGM